MGDSGIAIDDPFDVEIDCSALSCPSMSISGFCYFYAEQIAALLQFPGNLYLLGAGFMHHTHAQFHHPKETFGCGAGS